MGDVCSDGDVGGEIEVDWQWQKFEMFEEICVRNHQDVQNDGEFQGDWVE